MRVSKLKLSFAFSDISCVLKEYARIFIRGPPLALAAVEKGVFFSHKRMFIAETVGSMGGRRRLRKSWQRSGIVWHQLEGGPQGRMGWRDVSKAHGVKLRFT